MGLPNSIVLYSYRYSQRSIVSIVGFVLSSKQTQLIASASSPEFPGTQSNPPKLQQLSPEAPHGPHVRQDPTSSFVSGQQASKEVCTVGT